jgi:hypothetical protein
MNALNIIIYYGMTTNNTLFNTSDICQQRRRWQLFPTTLQRVELQPSPYGSFSKFQVDMRRKAEVLKYSPSKTNSQTNGLTQKQKFALISKGFSQKISIDTVTNICPNDNYIPTPNSACNVPGPLIYLYEEPGVPLYNYSDPLYDRSYALTQINDETPWTITDVSNVVFTHNNYSILSSIYVRINTPKTFTTFTLTTPLVIYISGITKNITAPTNFNFYISSFDISVFYNSTIVNSTDTDIIPAYGLSNPTTITQIVNKQVTITCNTNGPITAFQYIGNITLNSLQLYTSPGYVFDIKPIFQIIYPLNSSTYFTEVNSTVVCNIDATNLSSATGCTFVTSPASGYNRFSMTPVS